MNTKHRELLLDFFDDLTEKELSRLIYICLDCTLNEVAHRRKISKQAVAQSIQSIQKKRLHDEMIASIQSAIIEGGFLL